MKGRSRKRPPRKKEMKKALVIALAGVVMANSTGIGMIEGSAMEISAAGNRAGSQKESGSGAGDRSDAGETGGSEESQNGSGSAGNSSGSAENGSGEAENGSGGAGNGSSETEDGSGSVGSGSGETEDGSGSAGSGSGETEDGSGNAGSGSGETEDGSGSAGSGSGETEDGSGSAGSGSGETEDGSGSAEDGSGETEDGSGGTEDEESGGAADGNGSGEEAVNGGQTEEGSQPGGQENGGSQEGAGGENVQETPGEGEQPGDGEGGDESALPGETEEQENGSESQGGAGGPQKPVQMPPAVDTEKDSFSISYEYDHDLGRVKGPKKAGFMDSVYFTVTPKEGCAVSSVTANGEELEPIGRASLSDASREDGKWRYMLLDLEEDVTVEVEFEGNEVRMLGAEVPQAPEAAPQIEYQQMSDGFTVDYENSKKVDRGSDKYYKDITYCADIYIEENAGEQLNFVLSDVMYNLKAHFGDLTEMPGYRANYELNFINRSGGTYVYKADSLTAGPIDMGQYIEEDLEEYPEYPHTVGYDGQMIPKNYTKARSANKAIKKLFDGSNPSLEDMLGLYGKLAEKGYTGEQPLTDYYLDEYGNGQYEHMYDLPLETLAEIFGSKVGQNGRYSVSYAGTTYEDRLAGLKEQWPYLYVVDHNPSQEKFTVQICEAEPELAASAYNFWYRYCLGIGVGKKVTQADTQDGQFAIGLSNYLDPGSVLWTDADAGLQETLRFDDTQSEAVLEAGMGISGPNTGNSFANQETVFYAAFQLERVITEGTLTINKVDDDGSLILEKPATFQLYRMENGVKLYYTGADWSEDQADAASYTTVNGTVSIPGLKLNDTYYVQETAAPEGYELVETPYQVSMDSENVEISFSNKEQYTIVINYYLDGSSQKLADFYTSGPYTRGDAYDLTAQINKAIDGYTWARCDQEAFAGVVSDNMIINVYYTKNASHHGGGSSGGGGGGSSPDNGGNGRYQPEEGGPGTVEISQQEVPLAQLPKESQVSVIEPGQTPLAPLPKTGQATPWMALSALMAGVVLSLAALSRKREDEGQD